MRRVRLGGERRPPSLRASHGLFVSVCGGGRMSFSGRGGGPDRADCLFCHAALAGEHTGWHTVRMRIIIHGHARGHGLTDELIVSAYVTGHRSAVVRHRDKNAEPKRWATIGFDAEAREIELVFVALAAQAVLIFHANYATTTFKKEIRRAQDG